MARGKSQAHGDRRMSAFRRAIVTAAGLVCLALDLAAARGGGNGGDVSDNGGWLEATPAEAEKYATKRCHVDKVFADELSSGRFEREYKFKKPLIIKFRGGAADWCDVDKWTVAGIRDAYGQWNVTAGKSIEIVYTGGRPDMLTSFDKFVSEMRTSALTNADPTYLFDRTFYPQSSLPATIRVPSFLFTKEDTIFFLGGSGTGATFHKHMPAWNGVVFGRKRWILYPVEKTPPGGLHGYTSATWLKYVYPFLKEEDKPIECMQEAGEIVYLPESYYHAIMNVGETIAVSLQLKRAVTELEVEFYKAIDAGYAASLTDEERKKRNLHPGQTTSQLLAEAVRLYSDLYSLLPNNTEVMSHLASLNWQLLRDAKARKIYEDIIARDRFYVKAYVTLASWYKGHNMPEEALKTYAAALEVNPANKEAWREYANLLWEHERYSEAKEAYVKHWSLTDKETHEGQLAKDYIDQLEQLIADALPKGPPVVKPSGPRGYSRPPAAEAVAASSQ